MLLEKLENKSAVVGVVGLGYVGLLLILAYIRVGFHVIAFDIDASKITALTAGRSYIKHIIHINNKLSVSGGVEVYISQVQGRLRLFV